MAQTEAKYIEIPITIGRSALGESNYVFVKIQPIDGVRGNYLAEVPKKDITVQEQPPNETLTATLRVTVLKESKDSYIVETENARIGKGAKVRLKVNREQGKIEPVKYQPVFEY